MLLDGAGEPITHHRALVDVIGFVLSAQDLWVFVLVRTWASL